MSSYTVKQIADLLNTKEETVRRWIRSGKLDATWTSKKSGNVISSEALNKFLKETPKYATAVSGALITSPLAMSIVVGGLLGGLYAIFDERKNTALTSEDVEMFLKKEIAIHEKNLKFKNAELKKLQQEIDEEQQNLTNYKYALENLDLKHIASEINNRKK